MRTHGSVFYRPNKSCIYQQMANTFYFLKQFSLSIFCLFFKVRKSFEFEKDVFCQSGTQAYLETIQVLPKGVEAMTVRLLVRMLYHYQSVSGKSFLPVCIFSIKTTFV